MDIETLKLLVEIGPEAVTALGYYALSSFGKSVVIWGSISGTIAFICNKCWNISYWDALTDEQKRIVSLRKYKIITKEQAMLAEEIVE